MTSLYHDNFIKTILERSHSKDWNKAVKEWVIDDVEEDEELDASCICGKERLRYLYTISNYINGESLYPIGSSCIKKFGNKDMDEYTKVTEDLFKLLHAIKDHQFINLDSKYFTRKLLEYLFEEGAFQTNGKNYFDAKRDYYFMLRMFNKRDKDSISVAQKGKIRGLIAYTIKPFLEDRLEEKIISK